MKYMLLIYGARPSEPPTQSEIQDEMNQYWAYEKAVADAGVRIGSEALQGVETATTVAVADDVDRGVGGWRVVEGRAEGAVQRDDEERQAVHAHGRG